MNKKWNVGEFGVYPGAGAADCSKGICMALQKASEEPGTVEIVFPRGDYEIGADDKIAAFPVYAKQIKNVVLRGCGSRLLVTSPFNGVMAFEESENVTVDGFEVKYKAAPWTQGTITDVNTVNGTLIFESDEGYDLLADERFSCEGGAFGAVMDRDNPRLLKHSGPEQVYLKSYEKIGNRRYIITPGDPAHVQNGRIEPGDKIVYTNRGMSGAVFSFYKSRNITVTNITAHECGNCLFVAAYIGGDIVIDNYRAELAEGAYILSNADGVHIQGLRGRLIMENCCFEGLLDDCLNIYQFPATVREHVSEHELKIHQAEGNLPLEGDTVMFYRHDDGVKRITARVEAVRERDTENNTCIIRIDSACDGIVNGDSYAESDEMYILDSMAGGTVIRNNVFRTSRRYGLLLKTVDTVVEGNVFLDLGGDAVNFTADTTGTMGRGAEGPYAERVAVRNNRINNVCYLDSRQRQTKWASGGAIGIYEHNKDITVENNTFENMNGAKLAFYGSRVFIG